MNLFESPFKGVPLDQQIRNPNIRAGRYSYYSGYYHGHSFDDCARYLSPERDDVDKLIIGSFVPSAAAPASSWRAIRAIAWTGSPPSPFSTCRKRRASRGP